jgi:hypothetical protein
MDHRSGKIGTWPGLLKDGIGVCLNAIDAMEIPGVQGINAGDGIPGIVLATPPLNAAQLTISRG